MTFSVQSITDPSRAKRCCFKALGDKLHARRDNKRTTLTLKQTDAQGEDITREISVRVISGKDTNSPLIVDDIINHSLAIESDWIQGDEGLENRHARVYLSSKSLTTQLKKIGFTAEQIAKVIADISKNALPEVEEIPSLAAHSSSESSSIIGQPVPCSYRAIVVKSGEKFLRIDNKFDWFRHEATLIQSGAEVVTPTSLECRPPISKKQANRENLKSSMTYFLQVAKSVERLQKQGIDCSLAEHLPGANKASSRFSQFDFRAPEVQEGSTNGVEVDTWNLGTLLIEMLFPKISSDYQKYRFEYFLKHLKTPPSRNLEGRDKHNRTAKWCIREALRSAGSKLRHCGGFVRADEEIQHLMVDLLEYHPHHRISVREAVERAEMILNGLDYKTKLAK